MTNLNIGSLEGHPDAVLLLGDLDRELNHFPKPRNVVEIFVEFNKLTKLARMRMQSTEKDCREIIDEYQYILRGQVLNTFKICDKTIFTEIFLS